MNRFNQLLLIALALLYLAPTHAMVNSDEGLTSFCQVFADDDTEDGKKKDGTEGDEEEEEPDCD